MKIEPGSRWKSRLPYLIAGVFAFFLLMFSLFREMGVVGTWKLFSTQKQVLEENRKLREENALLQQEVEKLRTNAVYIEEIARGHGLIRDKENVIVLDRKGEGSSAIPEKKGTARP